MNLVQSNIKTMTSRQISEVTGKNHPDVVRDIILTLKHAEIDVSKFAGIYLDTMNRKQTEYILPRRECDLVISGYSVKYRLAIIDRWQELEADQDTPEMQMAKGLIAAQSLIEQQTKQIQELKPKADFYDDVTGSSDTISIGDVSKVLNIKGLGRNKLFELLRDKSILQLNNSPYQNYVDRGYFRLVESKYTKPDGTTHINLKTVVYQKGLDFIRKSVEAE